jgi:hypothetical protein
MKRKIPSSPRESNHRTPIVQPVVDRSVTLKWILGKYGENMWTGFMIQDRDHWQALVNTVMNLRVA